MRFIIDVVDSKYSDKNLIESRYKELENTLRGIKKSDNRFPVEYETAYIEFLKHYSLSTDPLRIRSFSIQAFVRDLKQNLSAVLNIEGDETNSYFYLTKELVFVKKRQSQIIDIIKNFLDRIEYEKSNVLPETNSISDKLRNYFNRTQMFSRQSTYQRGTKIVALHLLEVHINNITTLGIWGNKMTEKDLIDSYKIFLKLHLRFYNDIIIDNIYDSVLKLLNAIQPSDKRYNLFESLTKRYGSETVISIMNKVILAGNTETNLIINNTSNDLIKLIELIKPLNQTKEAKELRTYNPYIIHIFDISNFAFSRYLVNESLYPLLVYYSLVIRSNNPLQNVIKSIIDKKNTDRMKYINTIKKDIYFLSILKNNKAILYRTIVLNTIINLL